ncbi:MAG: PhoH family protein [Bacteroidales bacterium]|jgi:phosphate starvation-inducible PhoH-like protein|nr:PhoH family protein [Bacteroidales bacterium]
MGEKVLSVEGYDPLVIFGANEIKLEIIRRLFPQLKIIVRGEMIKLVGAESAFKSFEIFFDQVLMHIEQYQTLSESDLEKIAGTDAKTKEKFLPNDILVHGRNGAQIKARTENQQKMVASVSKNDLTLAIGPAGTGKTYTAVALAVRALKNKEVKRVILARPAVEAGESLGFLPGDMKEKLDPYMMPLYDALRDMLPVAKLEKYLEDGTIEIAPLAYMRGRTLDHVFAILDEAQNATPNQLKMFLTRMGITAKFIVTGDITQIDLPKKQQSGLVQATTILKNIPGIEIIYLDEKDIVRHPLVRKIIEAYKTDN